jgi:Mrp family chromosome partitioning ATPase
MSTPPKDLPILDDAAKHQEEEMLSQRMSGIRHKLLVLSGKGGVGKSTVAANLALALAKAGKRVGLLDVDIHGPSIPGILGLEDQQLSILGNEILPAQLSEKLAVVSIAFLLPSQRDAVIWRGPRKYGLIRQFLKDVMWGSLDYLVVDAPPGTGDEPLAVAELVGDSAEAVVITTPQQVAVSDVRRCVAFCDQVSLPVAGIVENMSGLVCPRCGEVINLFKRDGGKELAEEMEVPFLGSIPIDPGIVTAGDAGSPAFDGDETDASRAFDKVVGSILEKHGEDSEEDSE